MVNTVSKRGRRDWLTHKDFNLSAVTSCDMPRWLLTLSNPLPIQYSAREDSPFVARIRALFKSKSVVRSTPISPCLLCDSLRCRSGELNSQCDRYRELYSMLYSCPKDACLLNQNIREYACMLKSDDKNTYCDSSNICE